MSMSGRSKLGRRPWTFTLLKSPNNIAQIGGRKISGPSDADALDSDQWYNMGLDLEEADPDKAP